MVRSTPLNSINNRAKCGSVLVSSPGCFLDGRTLTEAKEAGLSREEQGRAS